MKKLLAISLAFFVISHSALALDFFVGVDALSTNARHSVQNLSSVAPTANKDTKSDTKNNFGVNAGIRLDLLNLMASGEVFYDNIHTKARSFNLTSGSSSGNTKIDSRYGAKLNLGTKILPLTTAFLTYGLTNVRYDSNLISSNQSLSKNKMTPLYGVGLMVDLPFSGLSLKAAYDFQKFNMKYADSSAKINTYLGVFRLGLIYNF